MKWSWRCRDGVVELGELDDCPLFFGIGLFVVEGFRMRSLRFGRDDKGRGLARVAGCVSLLEAGSSTSLGMTNGVVLRLGATSPSSGGTKKIPQIGDLKDLGWKAC